MIKIALGVYIGGLLATSITFVGTIPTLTTKPIWWDFPIIVTLVLCYPTVLGYWIGMESK